MNPESNLIESYPKIVKRILTPAILGLIGLSVAGVMYSNDKLNKSVKTANLELLSTTQHLNDTTSVSCDSLRDLANQDAIAGSTKKHFGEPFNPNSTTCRLP